MTPTGCSGSSTLLPTCSTFPAMTLRSPAPPRRRWSSWTDGTLLHLPAGGYPAPGQNARRRTKRWRQDLLSGPKRSWQRAQYAGGSGPQRHRQDQPDSARWRWRNTWLCERYSHVMHIGSTVRGQIRPDIRRGGRGGRHSPGGNAFRCAKVPGLSDHQTNWRTDKRGIYGGAIGYMDFTGNLDTCIAIRIAYTKNGKVYRPLRRGHRGRQRAGEANIRSASTRPRPWSVRSKRAEEGMES